MCQTFQGITAPCSFLLWVINLPYELISAQDVSVTWSGIRIQHQARVKPLAKEMTHFLFISLVALLCHISQTMCDFILFLFCLSFILITSCARSAYTVSSLRFLLLLRSCLLLCQMCQCNKVLYTVEFSTTPVIGEVSSAVVRTPKSLHCIRQANETPSVLSH